MKRPLFILATLSLLTSHHVTIMAAPGTLSQTPLFVAPAIQPNIMFMLDDSGSMMGSVRGTGSVTPSPTIAYFDTDPDQDRLAEGMYFPLPEQRWLSWCYPANLLAYNPALTYIPWQANIPGENTPYPNMDNLTQAWINPRVKDAGLVLGEGEFISVFDQGTVDISAAPVVTWQDNNNNGVYDNGECPLHSSDSGWVRADSLTTAEQINFANWFSYYRKKEYTTKAAIIKVIAASSARMGMATLHQNNDVGIEIKDMTLPVNKAALLENIVNIDSTGGTPLREALDNVGLYFDTASATPTDLNIGNAASPILPADEGGMCQQNFVMLMTDGVWTQNPEFTHIQHQDDSLIDKLVYPAHLDTEGDMLADVAMKWYKTDLSPLANKVPVQTGDNKLNLDQNNQQHLVTFGIAFDANGRINNDPVDRTIPFDWTGGGPRPDTFDYGTINRIDDLRHAAYNGRGKFLSASRADVLINELDGAIKSIEQRKGSGSSVALNMGVLSSDTKLFFAGFNSVGWTGNLQSFELDASTGAINTSNSWNAAEQLDKRSNDDMLNDRIIYTWGKDSSGTNNGVLFNSNISDPQTTAAMQADLNINFDHSVDTTPFSASQERLNFLRGDTRQEGINNTRQRTSRLGDIINSAPIFVAEPNSNWPDGALFGGAKKYSTYQAGLQATPRQEVVYVGANDGFLHGFSADNGQEILAYAPSSPASSLDNSGLHYLTETDYHHRAYVDGELSATDVFIKTSPSGTAAWRTVLAGALGAGGRGLFALDITDPSQFINDQNSAENTVLWEFTDGNDADLGFILGQPQVAMMNNGQWAVVVGNGYNASGSGSAQLMIIYLEQGIDGAWTAGDYVKVDTGQGTALNKNGLSQPALIDLDGNGTTDRVYAGDLFGNLWAFDLSESNSIDWKVGHGGSALFAAGNTKPITVKPLVVKPDANWLEDSNTNSPNMMVYFGTGQYLANGDQKSITQQTYYGIRDSGSSVAANVLVEQTFIAAPELDTRVLTKNDIDYETKSGWFINLPESGERVVVEAFELADIIFFNTMTPKDEDCDAGGTSWLMSVDMKTGGNPTIVAFDYSRDRILNIDDDHLLAGERFDYGIASKTSVLGTNNGVNIGYTSGTDNSPGPNSSTGNDASNGNAGFDKPDDRVLPGEIPIGERQSWIQLINN